MLISRSKISLLLILFVGFVVTQTALCQISIGLKLDNIKYMRGERIPLQITIENHVGEPLVFNDVYHNAELRLSVSSDGSNSGIGKEKTLKRDIVILSDDTVSKVVDLKKILKLSDFGSYQVKASIIYGGRIYSSYPKGFDIVDGVEMISRRRLLPGYTNIILTYSVRYLGRESKEDAYLVITDKDEGIIYGAFYLGHIVRVSKPVLKFDSKGEVIVVHQSGLYTFTRSVIQVQRDESMFVDQTFYDLKGNQIKPKKSEKTDSMESVDSIVKKEAASITKKVEKQKKK